MNAENPRSPGKSSSFSPEARIGTGITIAGLGLLGVLLGWAEHMRSEPGVGNGWLIVGAIFMIIGIIMALSGRSSAR